MWDSSLAWLQSAPSTTRLHYPGLDFIFYKPTSLPSWRGRKLAGTFPSESEQFSRVHVPASGYGLHEHSQVEERVRCAGLSEQEALV